MKSSLLQRLHGFGEDLANLFGKRKAWFLAGFSLLYLAVTCLLASHKLMWNDELYTFYLSRLASMSEVWSALSTGAEQTPPLFYVITRASLALFGTSELSVRLPEIIGFWVMCVCLFQIVSKRASALYGFVAMLFPLVTGAYYYAYEARAYGLVLGFSGLALLCWQSATETGERKIWPAGLAVSLAAAVSCHYYAVFVFIPIALGEAVRALSLRRLDLRVWLALGAGATPLILFLPLIQRAMDYSTTFWSKPRWTDMPLFYFLLLSPIVLPLIPLLILSAIFPAPIYTHRQSHAPPSSPPLYEIAAALGFVAIPVVAVTLCMLVTGAFTDRYAMPAVIGVSIFAALAARRLFYDRAAVVAALTLILSVFFLSIGLYHYHDLAKARSVQAQTEDFLRAKDPDGLPIAISDSLWFTRLAHYAPPDLAPRIIYLADADASLRYLGHNSIEKGMLDLIKPWFRLNVEEYRHFISAKERFLVYGKPTYFLNWLIFELERTGMRIEMQGRNGDFLLFLVHPKDKGEIPAALLPSSTQVP
jgi:4-amino-4-deoxy-L-arabinose transferase-like glycosyltransferase